jgi:hypothetical protein
MHKRQFRPDKAATKARRFKSRYSYVSTRIHPGTESQQCEYLAGDDCEIRRLEVFERDEFKCVGCGVEVPWDGPIEKRGHLAHGGNTKISRCWCPSNCSTKCFGCHFLREHNREVKFSAAWYR